MSQQKWLDNSPTPKSFVAVKMQVGIDISDCWIRAAQLAGPHAPPHAIPDLRDPKLLATRMSVQIDADGCLVGDIANELHREQPFGNFAADFRKRLTDDEPLLTDDSGREWLAEGLVALGLRKVQRDLLGLGRGTVESVTLTVPADSSHKYRERLRSAARLADLPQVQLLEEPIAAWTFVNSTTPYRGRSLIVHFGDSSSAVTLVDGTQACPRIIANDVIKEASRQQIELTAATQIEQDLSWPHSAPVGLSVESIRSELLRHVQKEFTVSLTQLLPTSRRAWLICGHVCEVHLRRTVWQAAWSPIRAALSQQIRQTMRQTGLPTENIGQVILSGEPVSGSGLETDLAAMFPQAILWNRPEMAAWLHAYGAALAGPSHAVFQTERTPNNESAPLTADVGILILNPTTRQPDLDVLIPAGTKPPFRASRRYQPQLAVQKSFSVELAQRQAQSPGYRSLARWETLLSSALEYPRVELACEFHNDGDVEIILSGDLETPTEVRHDVHLTNSNNERETNQRILLETTHWRD